MDIRLDDPKALAKHHIRIMPVVIRSLIGAGYHCLGDVRWVSSRQLRGLYYIGVKTAQNLVAIVHRFETNTGASAPVHSTAIQQATTRDQL